MSLINTCKQKQLLFFCAQSINNPLSWHTAALHPSNTGDSPQSRVFYPSISQHLQTKHPELHLVDIRRSANLPEDPDDSRAKNL